MLMGSPSFVKIIENRDYCGYSTNNFNHCLVLESALRYFGMFLMLTGVFFMYLIWYPALAQMRRHFTKLDLGMAALGLVLLILGSRFLKH